MQNNVKEQVKYKLYDKSSYENNKIVTCDLTPHDNVMLSHNTVVTQNHSLSNDKMDSPQGFDDVDVILHSDKFLLAELIVY